MINLSSFFDIHSHFARMKTRRECCQLASGPRKINKREKESNCVIRPLHLAADFMRGWFIFLLGLFSNEYFLA
jgi:hypothetical protein